MKVCGQLHSPGGLPSLRKTTIETEYGARNESIVGHKCLRRYLSLSHQPQGQICSRGSTTLQAIRSRISCVVTRPKIRTQCFIFDHYRCGDATRRNHNMHLPNTHTHAHTHTHRSFHMKF